MATLSPRARALIETGRRGLRATDADRVRVEEALRERLGAAVLPPDLVSPTASAWVGGQVIAKGVAVVFLAGGALLVSLNPHPRTHPAPPTIAPAQHAAPEVSSPAPELRPAPVAPPRPRVSPPRSELRAPRRPNHLAEEVSLLSRATSALRAGRAAEALRALDIHRRRFPAGALTEERLAARAQALCLLGRVSEGRAELVQLNPNSPAAARADQVCASPAGSSSR